MRSSGVSRRSPLTLILNKRPPRENGGGGAFFFSLAVAEKRGKKSCVRQWEWL